MPRHVPANAEPEADTVHYSGAEGGWGSMRGMALVERTALAGPSAGETLARQNKPGGFMCVSCSWAKPPNPHVAEFCVTQESSDGDILRARSGPPDSGRDSHLIGACESVARDCDGDAPCLGPTARICVIAL